MEHLVVASEFYDGYTFGPPIFGKYWYLVDEEAPKQHYVIYSSLLEERVPGGRDEYGRESYEKAKLFTKRKHFNVVLDYDMNPIEFYEQFEHGELIAIGV